MNYVEVRIQANVDSGELMGMFTGAGPVGAWESSEVVHLYWAQPDWNPEVLSELRAILKQLGTADRPGLISTTTVPDQDWNQSWARSLRPIRIGNGILIRQSWNAVEGCDAAVELVIDPRRAFGSGYHATTQLLLELLEQEIRGGEHVLDVGTGSGILAMAALRLGAARALGIDNDPVAIECARDYAAVNGFGAELELRVGTVAELGNGEYDIVLANIDARTLVPSAAQLVGLLAARGRLLLSGLQSGDYADIEAAVGAAAIACRRERDEWMALMVAGRHR